MDTEYNYLMMSVLDILKTFGKATRDEIQSYANSSPVVFDSLNELKLIELVPSEDSEEKDMFSLSEAGIAMWASKKSYGNNFHQDYQLADDEFKVLQLLSTHGPMTVMELMNILKINVLNSVSRLRHVELVVMVQKENSKSIFYTIAEDQRDEMIISLQERAKDDHYSAIATEIAGLEESKNFVSSFDGEPLEDVAAVTTSPQFQAGEVMIFFQCPEKVSDDVKEHFEYLKKMYEAGNSGDSRFFGFEMPIRNSNIDFPSPQMPFALASSVFSDRFDGVTKKEMYVPGFNFKAEEEVDLRLFRSLSAWQTHFQVYGYEAFNSKTPFREADPDPSHINIFFLSVLAKNKVVDAVGLYNVYPSRVSGSQTFHSPGLESNPYVHWTLNALDVRDDVEMLKIGQALLDRSKKDKEEK